MKLPEENRSTLHSKFRNLLTSIQNGRMPTSSELVACKELFSDKDIFSIDRLQKNHLDDLLVLHNQRGFFIKKLWLEEWVTYLHLVDVRIEMEGGTSKIPIEQLKKFCFQRGVNSNAMTEKEMREYMRQWIAFSAYVSSDHTSLLLHAPAFFGYNHKSNYSVTSDSSS